MWHKKIIDERVRNMQNQIYREVYNVITLICCLSIAYKFITIGISFQAISTEFFVLIGGSLYYVLRSAQLGLFSDEVEMHDANSKIKYSKKTILYGALLGLFIALSMGINSAVSYADSTEQAIYYFFLVSFVSLCIYAPFFTAFLYVGYYTSKKKSDKVNKKNLEEHDEW